MAALDLNRRSCVYSFFNFKLFNMAGDLALVGRATCYWGLWFYFCRRFGWPSAQALEKDSSGGGKGKPPGKQNGAKGKNTSNGPEKAQKQVDQATDTVNKAAKEVAKSANNAAAAVTSAISSAADAGSNKSWLDYFFGPPSKTSW